VRLSGLVRNACRTGVHVYHGRFLCLGVLGWAVYHRVRTGREVADATQLLLLTAAVLFQKVVVFVRHRVLLYSIAGASIPLILMAVRGG
jgi:hypothetical protein